MPPEKTQKGSPRGCFFGVANLPRPSKSVINPALKQNTHKAKSRKRSDFSSKKCYTEKA